MNDRLLFDLPWKTSRLIPILRVLFPRRWYVQIGGHVYILRYPPRDAASGGSPRA